MPEEVKDIPAVDMQPSGMERFLLAVREVMQIREGRRGNKLLRFVTALELAALTAKAVMKSGDTMTGNLAVSRVGADEAGISSGVAGGGAIALIGRSATAPVYGVFGASVAGLYCNTTMCFLADSGNEWLWGNAARRMRLEGAAGTCNLQVGTSNSLSTTVGHNGTNGYVRAQTGELQFGSAAFNAYKVRTDGAMELQDIGADPATPTEGTIWRVGNVLRKRSNGVTSNL